MANAITGSFCPPFCWGGDGAALGAMVRKIFKNDALAAILP
jgi:hypothetical protein